MLEPIHWGLLGLALKLPQLCLGEPPCQEDSTEGKPSAGTYHQCSVELWGAS